MFEHDRRSVARRLTSAAALVAAILVGSRTALAEYGLASGDVVEMSVVGMRDLRQRSSVDIDGKVSLPLVGSVDAVGLSVAGLRTRIQDLIGRKAVRQRSEDGRETSVLIEPDEVTLDLVEYRPVYVNGDVSRPGEVRFRSSLTVRQAVALAGGYDLMRFRLENPFLQAADLESDLRTQAAEYARQQARVARLEAELGGAPAIAPMADAGGTSIPAELGSHIRSLETERFKLRATDISQQAATLRTLIGFSNAELSSLNQQSSREEESSRLDEEDLQRNVGLYDRGSMTINRVVDARRISLLGSTRLLQTKVQVERVRRAREIDERNLSKLESERRLEVVADLQDARILMEGVRVKMAATGQKLLYTSTVRSQLIRGTGGRPNVVVIRQKPGGAPARMNAEEETALLPGDVVEVSLVADLASAGGQPQPPAAAP